jgi:hypothetical protein
VKARRTSPKPPSLAALESRTAALEAGLANAFRAISLLHVVRGELITRVRLIAQDLEASPSVEKRLARFLPDAIFDAALRGDPPFDDAPPRRGPVEDSILLDLRNALGEALPLDVERRLSSILRARGTTLDQLAIQLLEREAQTAEGAA